MTTTSPTPAVTAARAPSVPARPAGPARLWLVLAGLTLAGWLCGAGVGLLHERSALAAQGAAHAQELAAAQQQDRADVEALWRAGQEGQQSGRLDCVAYEPSPETRSSCQGAVWGTGFPLADAYDGVKRRHGW